MVYDTDRSKMEILERLREGHGITLACKEVNISRETFYKWRRTDPQFEEEADKARESTVLLVEDALFKNAIEGNTTAQIFFLCNRAKDRWKNVSQIEHSGPGGGPIEIEAARKLSNEELMEVLEKAKEQIGGKTHDLPSETASNHA